MSVSDRGDASLVKAVWRLPAAALSISLAAVVMRSTFVPLERGTHVEYVFLWPGTFPVITAVVASVAAVALLYVLIIRSIGRRRPERLAEARSAHWIVPVLPLGLLVLGVLPAAPGVGARAAILAHVLYELRWWWVAATAIGVAVRLHGLYEWRAPRWVAAAASCSPWVRLLAADTIVFVAVVVWSLTTNALAFSRVVHGDEPKYLRYCETFYQGNGFSFASNRLIDEVPLDAPSAVLANVGHAARAAIDESHALVQDLKGAAQNPLGFRWNRAEGRPAWFLVGKRGVEYQVHMPGLSFLLMPGYYLDRHLLSTEPGYQREFPENLTMTNATLLLLYALLAVALFRFLRNALGNDLTAGIAAIIAMIALPVTSFAFQIYPEVPAALLVVVVSNFLLFRAQASGALMRFTMGCAAGGLVWLHPRFVLLSAGFLVLGAFLIKGRRFASFLAGAGLIFATVGAYAYRLTGSWMPTAMYDANPESDAFMLRNVPVHVLSNAFDRIWGVLPHAPYLLLALPGLVLLARRRPMAAAMLAGLGLALWVAAAGHGLGAAGATPGRHVLAVIPLAAWPVAEFVRRFHRSAAAMTVAVVLIVLSIDAAASYNRWHEKPVGRMIDTDVSGWKPNLAFPVMVDWEDSRADQAVLALLLLALATGTVATFVADRRNPTETGRGSAPAVGGVLGAGAVLVGLAAGLSAITHATEADRGVVDRSDYLLPPVWARLAAARHIVELNGCRVCFSSATAAFNWNRLPPVAVRTFHLHHRVDDGGTVIFTVLAEGDTTEAVFGRVLLDFGDGENSGWVGVVGARNIRHRYAEPGKYVVVGRLRAPDPAELGARVTVEIEGYERQP